MLVATVIAPLLSCDRDDFGFFGMVFRVEDRVFELILLENAGEFFRNFDRLGSDQNRASLSVDLLDLFEDRVIFFPLGHVDFVIGIFSLAQGGGSELQELRACRSL